MTLSLEKPVKDFLAKFQQDLDNLQSTIRKEGDDLVKKVKLAASKENVDVKRKEFEKLVEAKLKKFEPAINKFVHELNVNAKKAGVDLTDLEQKVRSNLRTARNRLSKTAATVRAKGKKASKKSATSATIKKKKKKATSAKASPATDSGAAE
jgi:ElaB/YqjD/DUF883 family membrane-anchored ribosome-binding protein